MELGLVQDLDSLEHRVPPVQQELKVLQVEPCNVNMSSLDQILSKLDDIAQDPPTANSPSGDDEIPQPLRDYINSPLDDLNWKFLAPGLRQSNQHVIIINLDSHQRYLPNAA